MADIYAINGDKLTCTNGHVIGIFSRVVYKGERFYVDMLTNRHPKVDWRPNSILLDKCPDCGAAWNGGTGQMGVHFNQLYINGAWR